MFPPAYTLTVLVLTLLQLSFDKQYRPLCLGEAPTDAQVSRPGQRSSLQTNETVCERKWTRKEVRELSADELHTFIGTFNDYLASNSSLDGGQGVPELGVLQM